MEAPCKLDIIIVGCGISGLSLAYHLGKAGHRVNVLEAASILSEIGAGILLGPNASKLLSRWGLKEKLESISVKTQRMSFHNTGEPVQIINREKLEADYGAPQYQVHRADFQKLLCDLAFSFPNVKLRLNSRVVSVSPDGPSPCAVLHSGESIFGDAIIGADGVKSTIRSCIVGAPEVPRPVGIALYRVVLSTDAFLEDPDLRPFIEGSECSLWSGPGKLAVGYSVQARKGYNLALSHPDTGSAESWTAVGNVDEMRKMFEGWDPCLQKLLALVTSVLDFRLLTRNTLETWVHCGGLVTLIGDAAHPTLPYRGQGAAMAIEDAAVLGYLFARITSKSEIPTLLKGYESIRLDRATKMQVSSLEAGKMHLSDQGPAQQRDAVIKNDTESTIKELHGKNALVDSIEKPKLGPHRADDDEIYGYDAEKSAEGWWALHQQDRIEVAHSGT